MCRRRIHDLSIRNEAAEDGLEIAARYPREHAVVQALERCEDVLSSERHTLVLCCWLGSHSERLHPPCKERIRSAVVHSTMPCSSNTRSIDAISCSTVLTVPVLMIPASV